MNTPFPVKKPRWNPWPVCITAYFIVAFTGCGIFIAFCNRHPADLVAPDYYEKEVRYQSQIENMHRAESASVTFDAERQLIRISLARESLRAPATGSIQLYRPSATDLDRQIKLETDARGEQAVDARNLAPGLWKVRVSWTTGQQDYFIDRKVDVARKRS